MSGTEKLKRQIRKEIAEAKENLMKKSVDLAVEKTLRNSYKLADQLRTEVNDLFQLIKTSALLENGKDSDDEENSEDEEE